MANFHGPGGPTFKERCALIALEAFAQKVFDKSFQREAIDAGCEASDLLASYCWDIADAMEKNR